MRKSRGDNKRGAQLFPSLEIACGDVVVAPTSIDESSPMAIPLPRSWTAVVRELSSLAPSRLKARKEHEAPVMPSVLETPIPVAHLDRHENNTPPVFRYNPYAKKGESTRVPAETMASSFESARCFSRPEAQPSILPAPSVLPKGTVQAYPWFFSLSGMVDDVRIPSLDPEEEKILKNLW